MVTLTTTPQPYPTYRPSHVPWLGNVPEHWEVRRIKTLFREVDERSGDGQGELLSLTRSKGLVPHGQASNRIASVDDLSNYKVCYPGALVMNRMQAWSGMFAVASQDGLISPDYCVFEPVDSCEVKYFEHLFKTSLVVGQFAQRSKGIGSGFNRLYTDDFGSVPVVCPPLPEQRAIVRYLDHVDQRIQRYTAAKRKLIALLEEERQALIHRAVTRGLDPNVPLKPSGVQWLRDIPAHWEVRRLKHLLTEPLKYGANEPAQYTDPNLPRYIRITDIREDGTLRDDSFRSIPEEIAEHYLLATGDILFARSGATVGKTFQYDDSWGRAAYAGYLIRARLSRNTINSDFVKYFTQSQGYWSWLQGIFIQSTIQNVSAERYSNLSVPLPPLPEQTAIVEHLDKATAGIDAAIARARRRIELVQEYRTRLIADMVTGKLDVRDAAAQLPEEARQ